MSDSVAFSRHDFKLSNDDVNSAVWMRIKEHLEWQLKCLRERNDGNLSEIETAYMRGQIKHIKDFLTLESDREAVATDE